MASQKVPQIVAKSVPVPSCGPERRPLFVDRSISSPAMCMDSPSPTMSPRPAPAPPDAQPAKGLIPVSTSADSVMTDWQPELRSKRTAPAKRPSIFWLLAALGAGLAVLSSVPVPWLLPTQSIAPSELHPESDTFDKPPIVPADVPNSFLRARCLDEDRRFPLVLSPVEPSTSLDALAQWVQESRPLLQSWLEAYGAVRRDPRKSLTSNVAHPLRRSPIATLTHCDRRAGGLSWVCGPRACSL